jgi:hypothetical protein
MNRHACKRPLVYAASALSACMLFGCHSYHIDATIENRTGGPIQLLQVDYPSASFGADSVASDADFHYRFEVNGSGPLKLSYNTANGKLVQISGPTLVEREQGQLVIVLEPGNKAEFRSAEGSSQSPNAPH